MASSLVKVCKRTDGGRPQGRIVRQLFLQPLEVDTDRRQRIAHLVSEIGREFTDRGERLPLCELIERVA